MKTNTLFLRLSILMVILILSSCLKKNHPPTINDQAFTVDENSAEGTFVGNVIASDEDGQALFYKILGGNTDNAFRISETDGKITVNNKLAIDFESTPSFTLTIEAKDTKGKATNADVIINLKNIEILFSDQSFTIDEYSDNGVTAGQILGPGQSVKYSVISGNTDNAFSVSETNGKITVNNTDALDYSTSTKFMLVVQVKDEFEKATANITININNLVIPNSGLLLYMPFDGNVNDLSSSGNNGIDFTSHNYIAGKRSQALDFNGTSDFVRLTNTINSKYGLSFSFWVKTRGPNGAENNGSIISKYSKINNTRCFMVYSFGSYTTRNDNRLSAAFYEYGYSSGEHDMTKSYLETGELQVYPNPALWTITNPIRLVPGEWTHCLVNLTPTTIETWINGKFCTKKTREYSSYNNSDSEPVLIGNNYDIGEGTNNHFNGILDELRIYNRGLTVKEIKTLFKE